MDLYTTDLKKFANEDGLPIMNPSQFLIWTEKLGKERFREVLAEYIATFRPKFPLRQISYADMRTNITLLSRFNTSSICTPKEQIKKDVFEKYEDYKYNFKEYGLGIINGPNIFNTSSSDVSSLVFNFLNNDNEKFFIEKFPKCFFLTKFDQTF